MPTRLHSKHNGDSGCAVELRPFRADGFRLLAGHVLLAYGRPDVCHWLADRLNAEKPTPADLTAQVLALLMAHPAPGVFMPRDGLRGAGS
jgi:hypothetical protein